MHSYKIKNNPPAFCARYSIRGNVQKLSHEDYHKIKDACFSLGNKDDLIDMFIPDVAKYPQGAVAMSAFINGKMRAFHGPYKDGNIAGGILKGINFAKEHLFKYDLLREHYIRAQKQTLTIIPKLKHIKSGDLDL